MPSPLEQTGAARDSTRYGALTMGARALTGMWTQRCPFRDAAVPYEVAKYYSGSRFDSIIDGINREITVRLTDMRRPGSLVFNNLTFPRALSFYGWKYVQNTAEIVRTILDGADGAIYDATPGQKTTLMAKAAGAGPARFLGVNTQLFIGDGVEAKKVMRSAKTWQPNTVYNVGDFIIDPDLNIQKIQANPVVFDVASIAVVNAVIPSAGGATFLVVTLVEPAPTMPDNQTCSFAGLTAYTALNGQTLQWKAISEAFGTILNLSSDQIAFQFAAAPYGDTADTGTMTARINTPATSGGSEPTWDDTLGGVTEDGGIEWTCFGSSVENWGMVAPAAGTPEYTSFAAGPGVNFWRPLNGFGPSLTLALLDNNGNVQALFTPSSGTDWVNGPNLPAWSPNIGNVTRSGTAQYVNYGQPAPWYASAEYGGMTVAVANPCCILDPNGNLQGVTDVTTAGAAGTTAPTWGTTAGDTTTDGAITWICLGPGTILWSGDIGYAYSLHGVDGTLTNPSQTQLIANGGLGPAGGYQFDVTGTTTADPQCDQIWIWRTAQGKATLILAGIIPNPSIGTFTSFSFRDVLTDLQLNAQIAAPLPETADPPPANITAPAYYLNRIWAIVDNAVVYSAGPDALSANGNTAFPPLNSIPYIAQPIRLIPVTVQNGGLLVLTTDGVYIILGLGTASNPFYTTMYYAQVSITGYNAVDVANNAVFMMESNLKVSSLAIEYPFNPQGGYTEIGFPVGDQFMKVTTGGISASLYNPATAYLSWNQQSTNETGMYVADGAVGWFRMGIVSPPESGIVWSPRAGIIGGTSAVQSIETTPGGRQLLIGPTGSGGPILARDDSGTVWTDNSSLYPSWDSKGVNLLCSTGQWAETAHISHKSRAVGKRPSISVLIGEIVPTASRPWNRLNLAAKSEDPPLTRKSETYYSDRFVLAQNGVEDTGDCLLTLFDYGAQAFGDELFDWGIFASVHDERSEEAAAAK